jgi:hypothetical protein
MTSVRWVSLFVCLAFSLSCGRQTALSVDVIPNAQRLPFDRAPQTSGISPSHSFVPSVRRIPEGTAVTVSLENGLSSAKAHSNDTFTAVLDNPIVIDGQTIVPGGAVVTGRVLDARRAELPRDRGYLRIALTTLAVGGRQIPLSTSSLFAMGGSRRDWDPIESSHLAISANAAFEGIAPAREVDLGPSRRLTFRLTEDLDLQ